MKRAISIGLNYRGTHSQLGGCENDSDGFTSRLKSAGFSVEQIKQEIGVKELTDKLIYLRKSSPRDTFVLNYSGHGTQIYTEVEPDKYSEALVLFKNGMYEYIRDSELRSLLDKIPGTVYLILDSCFSGGMDRDAILPPEGAKKKNLPPVLSSEESVSEPLTASNKLYGMFASAEKEVSWDLGSNGMFSLQFFNVWDSLPVRSRTISKVMSKVRGRCIPDQTPNWFTTGGYPTKILF